MTLSLTGSVVTGLSSLPKIASISPLQEVNVGTANITNAKSIKNFFFLIIVIFIGLVLISIIFAHPGRNTVFGILTDVHVEEAIVLAVVGFRTEEILHRFSWAGYFVAAVCIIAILILLHFLLRKLSIYNKVKATIGGIWQGVISLKNVRNIPLFLFFTIGIWLSYFLHYYLTFFCFDFTADLGIGCALVTFIVGSIAVIVPTPNGAGPWHFAVKTMLILYGVQDEHALYFVLIVHTVQTLLVVALGIYAWIALNFTSIKTLKN